MRFVSAEELVIDFLNPRLVPRVTTRVPNPRPESFVQVRRTGGAAQNRVVDRPQITVTSWHESDEAAAEAVALTCRDALLSDHVDMPLVRGVTESGGLYYDPDPDSGSPRYTFTVSMAVRAPRN